MKVLGNILIPVGGIMCIVFGAGALAGQDATIETTAMVLIGMVLMFIGNRMVKSRK